MTSKQGIGKKGTMIGDETGDKTGDKTGDAGACRGGDAAAVAICGCGARTEPEHRRALGVDAEIRDRNLKRLRRIEGQVRGLQRMVEEDRYCPDIMTQLSSVHEALRGVGRELMRNHLKHCATSAIRDGDADAAEGMYDELVNMMYRHAR